LQLRPLLDDGISFFQLLRDKIGLRLDTSGIATWPSVLHMSVAKINVKVIGEDEDPEDEDAEDEDPSPTPASTPTPAVQDSMTRLLDDARSNLPNGVTAAVQDVELSYNGTRVLLVLKLKISEQDQNAVKASLVQPLHTMPGVCMTYPSYREPHITISRAECKDGIAHDALMKEFRLLEANMTNIRGVPLKFELIEVVVSKEYSSEPVIDGSGHTYPNWRTRKQLFV